MRRVRQLADRTPASRERFVDFLRAVAITLVVLGHWLITVIERDTHGQLTGHSALRDLPWSHPLTWLFQVLPLFFLVGGYANAASLTAHRARGGDGVGWLQERAARLVRPTTVLMVVLAGIAAGSQLAGAEPGRARTVVWFASIPLWFLSAYLAVVALTPLMYALHERFGLAVPLVLVGLVALGDVARLTGWPRVGAVNFLTGWLAIHQIGFAWRTERAGTARPGRGPIRAGRLPARPRVAVPLLVGGLASVVVLTVVGPYPISMVDVPGERLHNMSPPTLALLAYTTAQLGLVLLLRDQVERWLHHPGPWRVVVAVNAVILTIFLWHISAALLLSGGLNFLGLLPTPTVGTTAWWLWRIPWLLMLIVVLAPLVAIFGRFETHVARRPAIRPRWLPAGLAHVLTRPAPGLLLTGAGYAGTVSGLLSNNLAPKAGHYPLGMPTAGLVAFLAGAAVLRLLGSVPGGGAPARPPGTATVSSGSENPG